MDPNILLLVVLVVLLVWMFFSSRRRQQKMREEQERKAELMVPGARVMTRSGLFGTLVEFDKDDLSQPAKVEIAPGVVVELHTQAVDLAPEVVATEPEADTTEDVEPTTTVVDTAPDSSTATGADGLPGSGTVADKGDDKKD
jgi:preprotein translocase subunit YajC